MRGLWRGSTFIIQVRKCFKICEAVTPVIGHGTHNATVQLDKNNYTRTLTDKEFETVYATKTESVSYGDCLIGTAGKLYPVVELKQDLLKMKCKTWTITLDMCRSEASRGSKGGDNARVDSVRKVELRSVDMRMNYKLQN